MIQTFLDKKVPLDWNSFDINKRFQFYNGLMQVPETDLVERTQFCKNRRPLEWLLARGDNAVSSRHDDDSA